MKYILWDKKSNINGVAAAEILSSQPQLAYEEEIVLEIDEKTSRVTRIESVSVLKSVCDAPLDIDALNIIPYFDEYTNKQNNAPSKKNDVEQLQEDNLFIAETLALALEEIEQLKTEISAVKGAQ